MSNARKLSLWLGTLSPFRYTAKCGHRTKRSGSVSAFGHTITMKMPRNESRSVDYCLDCIGKMTIRCGWCSEPIFIGEPITLYGHSPRCEVLFSSEEKKQAQKAREQDSFVVPDNAVIYSKNPLTFVGCLSRDCADTIADRAGFWLPSENGKGHVYRVPTAYETMLGASNKSILVINDIHDIKEALNPTLIPIKKK